VSAGAENPVELLRSVWGWIGLEESQLERLATQVEMVSVPAGEWLFRAGDEARAAYVVASGRLEVLTEEPEAAIVRVLRRGSPVGELALLRGGVRSASIRAQRDSTLISLQRNQFEELLQSSPAFALALTRALGEQLASTLAPATRMPRPRTIAILALDPAVDTEPAFDALARQLDAFANTARFRGHPEAHESDWIGQLARAEADSDNVVLLADARNGDGAWRAFCVAEADLVVAVRSGTRLPADTPQAAGLPGCDLVCVDAPASDALIDGLRPRIVRAVRGEEGLTSAMREVARRASGRALGIVFSGGGARALSHVGVIEELERHGVSFDRIAGVSLGAIVAAAVARGDTPEARYAYCERYFVERNPSNDYTLPLVALTRGRKVARLVDEVFGSTRIEELPRPFFCTSTDLLHRQLVVHRSESLAGALLASVSIPGVLPPVLDRHQRVLVDGGVIDNLPVRAMTEDDGGPVIAVDVTGARGEPADTARRGRSASTVGALRRRITGSEVPLPRLQETIVRCMTLGSADTMALAREHADLVIAPDVSHIGLLDWSRLPEARRAGALAARAALEQHADFFARVGGI
jgi:NTE family protein